MANKPPSVALVYDRINKYGGAERVLECLHTIFPKAPLFTSVFNPATAAWTNGFDIRPSFLNSLPFAKTNHETFVMAMPYAFESHDLSAFDIIISITSAEAKSVITSPKQLHLCYMLTPTRYLWSHAHEYRGSGFGGLVKLAFQSALRRHDYLASKRPDALATISRTVEQRTLKYYGRNSTVIYPPVDTSAFTMHPTDCTRESKEYYLIVSRLVKYKKIDQVIKAVNQLPHKKLIIVGSGRESESLKAMARSNIQFKNNVSVSELSCLYHHATALICPQEEDFGLVAVEAHAAGTPVITLNKGGISEIVIPDTTGLHLQDTSPSALVPILQSFSKNHYSRDSISRRASEFDTSVFINKFTSYVEAEWQKKISQ